MNVSRPVVYGLVALVAAVALWYTSDEPKPSKPPTKKPAAAAALATKSDYTEADYLAKFEKPTDPKHDLFQPLIRARAALVPAAEATKDSFRIPALLAGGDPNWAYTGLAEVDGQRLALLENSGTHQSGFVKEGDPWKGAKIKRISTDSLTMVDQDGNDQVVPRYDPNQPEKPKEAPSGGFQPLQFGSSLRGAILPDIRLEPEPAAKGMIKRNSKS